MITEYLLPARKQNYKPRMLVNLSLFLSSIILLRLVFPFGIMAIASSDLSGFLLDLKQLPFAVSLISTFLILDFAIYWQHRFFHVFKPLWRLHKIHHSDISMDFTTALRFHPFEIMLSGLYKIILILLLGVDPVIYLYYEIALNTFAIFNHSNIYINRSFDRYLSMIIATPRFHTPHHSPVRAMTNSNYGNILSIWDRVFQSYTPFEETNFGLEDVDTSEANNFAQMHLSPFKGGSIFDLFRK